MEEKFDELLLAKSWDELTQEEKDLALKFVVSADEYTSMRKLSLALLDAPKAPVVADKSILTSVLKRSGGTQSASLAERIFGYRMPAYATALLLIAVAGSMYFIAESNQPVVETTQSKLQTNIVVITDTVFVDRPADTVYVNRVVYKYLPAQKSTSVLTSVTPEAESTEGVSMKEKEELQTLLVTGVE